MFSFKHYLEETKKTGCTCWTGYKRVSGTKPCSPGSCVKEETISESSTDLDKHISAFSKGIKSSGTQQSTYKSGGGKINNVKHVSTDADHQAIFKHLQKMGYKKTSGYDSKPNEFNMHHNRDEMTSKSDPVHHSSGVSAHIEKEHGGSTKVHFTKNKG